MRRAQQLGRYHLLDRIAFGGMAEIYRAKTFDAQGHAHLVAVKRVLAHLAEDDDFIQMLVDEAKIAGLLKHQNIARVYEFARAHGEYFIAMEHVDGKDLRTILERCRRRKKPMPPQHAAYIAAEIAGALHAAHVAADSSGRPLRIVHRDVSPSNVIGSYTGEVKLCDFGIAKATLSRVNTKTGVIKGKVKYMSPEQALGRKLDHRSDIFSLGSCLYEMLTRVPPFTATNEMDLLIKVRDAKYRPIRDIVPNVPPELEELCDNCLARSRAKRYQTAREVGEVLRGFLKRYMPTYSRSHLGRYIRKMFATEIERELRMLEEYVLDEEVDEDFGENLISEVLGPNAEFVGFSPKPSGETSEHGDGFADPPVQSGAPIHRAPSVHQEVPPDFQAPAAHHVPAPETASPEPRSPSVPQAARPDPDADSDISTEVASEIKTGVAPQRASQPRSSSDADADTVDGFNVHDASTLILEKPQRAEAPRAVEIGGSREDYDEALHSAPTLILDHRRHRKRRREEG